ncbi:hydantoinase/oxoprolinase family protein [Evansella sp. LMS18]|jgi:N-methylhydantoinase A|uniref:hydantoinase/oxoprolinase family protein n=1 Tax=Evansella sp. LMS18 TaxID=2924033 RepID=UPI0020D1CC16|nr:hydantoinase/oxoprolinase family protein [Evansella sp. LMS18]UTR10258.1 hydantoinase/oxoprolinase family protein [Evansella sp. LMS18]
MYRIAVDVGGTFTDIVLQNESTGEIYGTKTPSTPADQSIGLMTGITKICEENSVDIAEVESIIHGTTVATNAVLEGKGAKVGLITTEGFEQVLHVARSWTPAPISAWMGFLKPDPLADLIYTRGAKERITAQGDVLKELDEDHIRREIEYLYEEGVQSLTVSLINSYANPAHEVRIREIAEEINPDILVTISYDILPEFREYERTLTTVMNSYVRPPMQKYLTNIQSKIEEQKLQCRISIVRSDGGLMSIPAASSRPVHTMLSGPSGGVTASASIGAQAGYRNVISFDMGGTSTDVALTYDGTPRVARETKVGVFPVKSPSLEVVSIGAGGGSIAHVPLTGALRVGPQSAGSEPGPACYGRGGEEPSVTDANVLLGYLPPSLVGGEMKLDTEASKVAMEKVAEKLNTDVYRAAKGVYDIVNENMYGATRVVSVEKGYDPREFSLVALGGAGPLHANALGELTGCFPVIVPPTPGVLSALGFLQSDIRNEYSKTFIHTLSNLSTKQIVDELSSLGAECDKWLEDEKVSEKQRTIKYEVDVRYFRQGHEIPMEVTREELERDGLVSLKERFDSIHENNYGFKMDTDVEVVNIRAVAVGKVLSPAIPLSEPGDTDSSHAIIDEKHQAYFDGKFTDTPIYERTLLKPNNVVYGPAVISQKDTTTLILPAYKAEIDNFMNILIQKGDL